MNKTIQNALDSFSKEVMTKEDLSSLDVKNFLDIIAKELNLMQIYVAETTGVNTQFIYPYTSSGPYENTAFYNLLVFTEEDIAKFIDFFKNGKAHVLDKEISMSKKSTAVGNLIYGFLENGKMYGFVSFQPNEGETRIWTDEEKEIIRQLSFILRPLLLIRQLNDRFAYKKSIVKSSIGLFWYYPKLKIIIFPENTMDKFSIKNYVYRNAPQSLCEDFVHPDFASQFNSLFIDFDELCEKNECTFLGKEKKEGEEYHLSLSTNRFDDKGKPVEIMGFMERKEKSNHSLEKKDFLKRYEKFHETVSENNVVEYYVNLRNGEVTPFKTQSVFKDCFVFSDSFDKVIAYTAEHFLSQESKEVFIRTLNCDYLSSHLSKESPTLSIVSTFLINNEKKRLETIIIFNSQSIYEHAKDVMIFVRDVTQSEFLNYDQLTGLLTLSHFLKTLNQAQMERKGNATFSKSEIIYFDFVDFKLYNFEYGIKEGDNCLAAFADILKKIYTGCSICRASDDHFIVYDNSSDSMDNVENKIKDAIGQFDDFTSGKLKAKAGYCEMGDSSLEPSILIDCAKIAFQYAKRNPLENYSKYDEKLKNQDEKRKYICENIQKAIENGYIKAYYQPVITPSGNLVAFEALSRWEDPKYGFLSPGEFIPALEQHNLLYLLDNYMAEEVCRKMREELNRNHKVYQTSFNLSRNDFISCRPIREIENARKKYDIPSSLLAIEITESVMIENPEIIKKSIAEFHSHGYEIWMDDFGSGYSSLNVMKDFEFDEIKIDMGFLRTFNEKSKIIIKNIVHLAKDLSLRTLTEGVETKEHVEFLAQCGCDRMQGYYFSRPLPYDDVMKKLSEEKIKF